MLSCAYHNPVPVQWFFIGVMALWNICIENFVQIFSPKPCLILIKLYIGFIVVSDIGIRCHDSILVVHFSHGYLFYNFLSCPFLQKKSTQLKQTPVFPIVYYNLHYRVSPFTSVLYGYVIPLQYKLYRPGAFKMVCSYTVVEFIVSPA